MDKYYSLLEEASKKLIELSRHPEFSTELLSKAPPVLWFGNNTTTKEKIVTIGANPSREEFLSENKFKAGQRLLNEGTFKYLEQNLNRFKILNESQNWIDIIDNKALQEEILTSYNNYFIKNPYKWFGKKSSGQVLSYNVEGFINALDSSFYEGDKRYQCLHIDLMPFPTVSDFTTILKESEKHIFDNGWAKEFLSKLVDEIDPKFMIVFGRTNFKYLKKYLEIKPSEIEKTSVFNALTENGKKSSAEYCIMKYKNINVIGLSVNLGNPKGFSKKTLHELGKSIFQQIDN